jgi:hypothetical protein
LRKYSILLTGFQNKKYRLGEIICINTVYKGIKFCARCGKNQVSTCDPQITGVRQDCVLIPYQFNTLMNDIVECTDAERTHALITGVINIPGFLHAEDPSMTSFKNHILQKTIDVVDNYCKSLNSRCDLNKIKITFLGGGGG